MTRSPARLCTLFLLSSTACLSDTPENPLGAVQPEAVMVFFQVDGQVYGRGSPGAVPAGIEHVYIAAHPSGVSQVSEVAADGSFSFGVRASSRDTLELAPAEDREARRRGSSVFIRVPATKLPAQDFICCRSAGAELGGCERPAEAQVCDPSAALINPCRNDRECAFLSRYVISLAPDTITLAPPDARGRSTITVQPDRLPPNALVRIENRGRPDAPRLKLRTGVITDERGRFEQSIAAEGDDQVVFQVIDFENYRSLEHAVFVPDAPLTELDIVGAFPFEALAGGTTGRIGLRFALSGADQRGICPDSGEGPALCLSGGRAAEAGGGVGAYDGGIDYSMIEIGQFLLDGFPVTPAPAALGPALPTRKFTDGEIRSGPQRVYLLLDDSNAARAADPEAIRVRAAESFLASMRKRDLVGLIVYGQSEPQLLVEPTLDRETLLARVRALPNQAPGLTSAPDAFRALKLATERLRDDEASDRAEDRASRIALIAGAPPTGSAEDVAAVLERVIPAPETLFPGYPVYVAGLNQAGGALAADLESVARFSGGVYSSTEGEPSGLLSSVSDLIGRLSGAFILVYDVPIPSSTGNKAAEVELTATFRIGSGEGRQEATSSYKGVILVRD